MSLTFLSHRKLSGSSDQAATGVPSQNQQSREATSISIDANESRKPTTFCRLGEANFEKELGNRSQAV
jgi:hypothetical protein